MSCLTGRNFLEVTFLFRFLEYLWEYLSDCLEISSWWWVLTWWRVLRLSSTIVSMFLSLASSSVTVLSIAARVGCIHSTISPLMVLSIPHSFLNVLFDWSELLGGYFPLPFLGVSLRIYLGLSRPFPSLLLSLLLNSSLSGMMSESLRESSRRESLSFECNQNSRKYLKECLEWWLSIVFFFVNVMLSSLVCGRRSLMFWILEIHFFTVSDLGLLVFLR